MAREKESFRDNLERINNAYPDKEILSKSDVVRYTGLNWRTVEKLYTFKKNYISKVKLASEMS